MSRVTEQIRIDGILNEAVWREGPTIGELVQTEPRPGEPPSEPTEIRLSFDQQALYIAVYCLDSLPEALVAKQMSRDARLFSDDNIEILIDTFHDRRNAYFFSTNPIGAMVDGRITENRREDTNWDGIWNVETRVVDDGWIAEFEIPFKTLAFHPNNDIWGFNVSRQLGRLRESSRWASPSLDIEFTQVSMAGAIDGLFDMTQGIGLDIKPYGLVGFSRDIEGAGRTRVPADVGGDVFYRVTANLMSSTTFNTDFAETEVDTRQVNLTRFSLFFPEKRTFFLEDAGIFEFGISGRGGGFRRRAPDIIPFFSRRIGLVDDQPVPIRVGQKLTGKVGVFDVGLMDVVTGDSPEAAGQNLFVGRTKANFWSQSYVGALLTHGEASGETDNNLVGVDMKLATADFLKSGKNLELTTYGSKTSTPELRGNDMAYGVQVSYPNDLVSATYQWQQIGENYQPALGYVRRSGVRKNFLRASLRPRPERWNIRQVQFTVDFAQYYNLAHRDVETRTLQITPFELEFDGGERFEYRVTPTLETLFEPFEIRDDISIPVGDYSFVNNRLSYRSPGNKPWQYDIEYQFGSFFTGSTDELSTELNWRNANITASFELQQVWVRLREGNFNTQLALFRFDYSFSPLTTLSNFVQYDADSENVGLQSRLRWILKPGNEIFLVLNHSWQRSFLDRFESLHTDVRAKVSYTIRF